MTNELLQQAVWLAVQAIALPVPPWVSRLVQSHLNPAMNLGC